MLKLKVTITGNKVILGGFSAIADELPSAVRMGLRRIIVGVANEGKKLTHGVGSAGVYRKSKTGGKYWVKRDTPVQAGGYPVPIRSAHLNQLLGTVEPGEIIESNGKSFTAGLLEGVVFDSAAYADVIHFGKGTSKKYGPRPFLTDALENFDQGGKIVETMEQEIQKVINKSKDK